MARARARLSRAERRARRAPGDEFARQQQRLGKGAAREVEFVQHGDDGAPLAAPLRDQRQQIVGRRLVDGAERLVEQDDALVLHDQPREQHALHLPAGQRLDRAVLHAGEADARDGRRDARALGGVEAAEEADARAWRPWR